MPKNLLPAENTKTFTDQPHPGHNRWHPDISPVASVKPGDVFRADCREWFHGAIKNVDSTDDVHNAPLPGVHLLSRPLRVDGAEAGDLLIVDILEIDACDQEDERPLSGIGWGYTGGCSPSPTARWSLRWLTRRRPATSLRWARRWRRRRLTAGPLWCR